MSAIGMLVRRAWRQHAVASLLLVVLAGASAALVGASFQAVSRADTSLPRFIQRNHVFDEIVQGCPPGVDPTSLRSQIDLLEQCANPAVSRRLQRLLDTLAAVARTSGAATLVVGIQDPSVSNGWGRLGLLEALTTPGAQLGRGNPIMVEGRMVDPEARDEIVVSEAAARDAHLHAGSTVQLSGWSQAHLDKAIDGKVEPETPVSTAHIVGVVRFIDDVQVKPDLSLSDAIISGNLYAGAGWYRAHASTFSGYGTGVLVRFADTPRAASQVRHRLAKAGWQVNVSSLTDVSQSSPRKVIDIERRALIVFALIAIAAGLAFIGSVSIRQLRREANEVAGLHALGMAGAQQRLTNTVRAVTIGIPAAVVALIGVVLLSPFGPVGLARKLEVDHGIHFDALVLALTAVLVLVLFAGFGAVVRVRPPTRRASVRPSRVATAARALGPVATVGATVARGRSTRAAIAMTAVAVAAGIAAAGIVGSYDQLVDTPEHYGAWWDVAVGQYSEHAPFREGVALLRANPNVVAAAGYGDDTTIATIDGRPTWLVATANYIGHREPVTTSGRAPRTDREIALGRDTARTLHKGVGDEVVIRAGGRPDLRMRVVGIAVVNDPISSDAKPGKGALVRYPVMTTLSRATTPQSLVIAIDPHRDRSRAIRSLQRDFPGSIRAVSPQSDVRNVGRLRTLPWLLAGLIAALALATVVHALVTILGRHRAALAVVGALGFTRRQRRAVAIVASAGLTLVGAAIGIPLGLLLGDRVWTAMADGIGLAVGVVQPWSALVFAPLAALLGAVLVAVVTSRRSVRLRPGQQLRVE